MGVMVKEHLSLELGGAGPAACQSTPLAARLLISSSSVPAHKPPSLQFVQPACRPRATAMSAAPVSRPAPPPPASPPPPPPLTPPMGLPSLRALARAQPRATAVAHPATWSGSASSADEVAAPARMLYRMSIAALVDDRGRDDRGDDDADDASSSSSSDGVQFVGSTRPPSGPRSAYAPLSNASHESRLLQGHLKRRWSLGPHVPDDDFSSSDSDEEDTYVRSGSATSAPPAKQPKTALTKPKAPAPKPARRTMKKKASTKAASGTLVVYQPTCLDHHNDAHQENRARLSALCGPDGILQKPRFRALRWANLRELKPARLGDILRVHSFQYIQHLEKVCNALPPQTKACTVGTFYAESDATQLKKASKSRSSDGDDDDDVASAPLYPNDWMQTKHAQKCYAAAHPPSGGHFDNDSPISRSSYLAARLAAGAVCHAIDRVVRGDTRNAFVAVRPPGHHAGPNGCVESAGFHRRPEMCTCGFCLLNNVAIGAAYAMTTYSGAYYGNDGGGQSPTPTIERVAIIDFDIHHGNGTEEILRNLVPHQQAYPLPSSWAPLSFASYKPWRDERDVDNVFFASIHLHDGDNFYPCSGTGPQGDSPELKDQDNIMNLPLDFIGPRYLEDRERLTVKAKKSLMERASRAFRERVTTRLVPALRKFRPDLVMLSSGFDGHADDFYYYLSEADYEWMTEQLARVANECCEGRLVSVLEGGYNVELSAAQKRKLKAKNKGSKKRWGASSTSSSPAASPARSTLTEGEDDDDENMGDEGSEEEDEQLVYGSLARSCAAHVMALQRAGSQK